jgi:hypothetical protein
MGRQEGRKMERPKDIYTDRQIATFRRILPFSPSGPVSQATWCQIPKD